jgi:hypothetical protein
LLSKPFILLSGSCVAVERQYHLETSVRIALLGDTIPRNVKQTKEKGSVGDEHVWEMPF